MELVPVDAGPVFLGSPVTPLALAGSRREQSVHLAVRRHDPQDLGRRQRRLGVHVAPPEDRLDAPDRREPPVHPEHLPQPGVDPALDHVVGGGPLAAPLIRHLHEGEQLAGPDQLVERPARPAQALVDVLLLPVPQRELPQEALPPGAPRGIVGEPCRRGIGALHPEQPPGQRVELDARVQLGPARGVPPHLAEGVEGAALDARGGPHGAGGLGEPRRAVGDRHGGRGHPHHEGGPRARALALGEVPRDDVLPRAGYEHDGVAPDPDAVEEDDVAHLAGPGGDRPYLPELPGRPLERGARAAHVGLGLLGEQPA